jgi:ABC-type bacteriocin/lantibiotic exporter with double-glycine peptidase domain
LLVYLFPFGLLIIEGPRFIGTNLFIIWDSLFQTAHKFGYLTNWSEYTAPRTLLDKFLTLPEKDDNLRGTKFPSALLIEKVIFNQVAFKYQGNNDWINYNNTFSTGKINYLSTPNGSGKTTQLYLLLGLISPVKGQIILKSKGGSHDLAELNLKHWRQKNIAYCSYQTLIKEGSTGQKQLANLKQVLKNKNPAQIFIFDEADNALDKQNKIWFQTQLEKLVKKNKMVIQVRQLQKD